METELSTGVVGSAGTAAVGASRKKLGRDFVTIAVDFLAFVDALAIIFAAYLTNLAYAEFFPNGDFDTPFWSTYGAHALIGAIVGSYALFDRSFSTVASRQGDGAIIRILTRRFCVYAAVMLGLGFATRALDSLPRAWVSLWLAGSYSFALSSRLLLANQLRLLERRGILREAVAVVGAGPVADRLIRYLHEVKPGGVEIVGVFDDRNKRLPASVTQPSGTVEQLVELGKKRPIDWILVTFPCSAESRLLSVTHQLKTLSVAVALCPQQVGLKVPYHGLDFVGNDLPVRLLADRPLRRWNAVIKSLEDIVLGGLITLAILPLLGLIALAVKLDSPGPVIFRQKRHGWNNQEFDVFKFRSMVWDPTGTGGELRQTARGDARITRIGRFLRRTSLDELPQLFNVLRGDMSLIGPRPHAVNMKTEDHLGHEIIEVYAHRHRVKPGITGWAQVNGYRGATDTAELLRKRVELDIYYVENWSLAFDIKILFMTLLHVLKGQNAY
jgi:Undecaprenyl-phosphate glucose phosphotransferase